MCSSVNAAGCAIKGAYIVSVDGRQPLLLMMSLPASHQLKVDEENLSKLFSHQSHLSLLASNTNWKTGTNSVPQSLYMLSDSNTNVNSMINRRVSLFYQYPLEASHHMVCPCTLYGVCVVCPGTSELVSQHFHGIASILETNFDFYEESIPTEVVKLAIHAIHPDATTLKEVLLHFFAGGPCKLLIAANLKS